MSREIELVYSEQATDFVKGRAYSNPRYFSTPRSGVKKVYLIGSWPKIEKAYKAIGVPVEHLDESLQKVDPPSVAEKADLPKQPDYSHIEIPDGWRDMPWIGADSIRTLATKLTDAPVINKSQAVAVITAELAKRGTTEPQPQQATESSPPSTPEPRIVEGAGHAAGSGIPTTEEKSE